MARLLYGEFTSQAEAFWHHLSTTGVERGLIGPREVPRLWERHILNCAVVTDLLSQQDTILDLGSGAGLPGLAMAIRRPELEFILVEPMQRRVEWLTQVTDDLGLTNVEVRRARAQDLGGELKVSVVTARAVASLTELVFWAAPLLKPRGRLVALKGAKAPAEMQELQTATAAGGTVSAQSHVVGTGILPQATTVVEVRANWPRVISLTSSKPSRNTARGRTKPTR